MQRTYNIPSRQLGEARKKIKFDPQVLATKQISEFDTELIEELPKSQEIKPVAASEPEYSISIDQEKKRNRELVSNLLQTSSRTVQQPHRSSGILLKEPLDQQQQPQVKKSTSKKPVQIVSENWKRFSAELKKPTSNIARRGNDSQVKPHSTEFVAIDCEFVECQNGEQVARISIVNEQLEELFESYIRPAEKIVDYRTHITGITYGHIKKAPTWEQVKYQVEKVLVRKCVVGHTLWKDLEVMGMSNWSGFKGLIDISKYSQYQEGGKLQSLKRLAAVFLEKDIQLGTHSSLQDAKATMSLFLLRKQKILSEIERNKKFQQRQKARIAREQEPVEN